MRLGPHCRMPASSNRVTEHDPFMSKSLHIMSTRVAENPYGTDYHGAAWRGGEGSPVGSDLSPDEDGYFPNPKPCFIVDISHMLSRALGKQMPMTATYRLTGLKIGIQNVDSVGDDNDRSAFFSGYVFYHGATKHKIDALQAARQVERASEEAELDTDSVFFRMARAYNGFRFNWNQDDQVLYPKDAGMVGDWVAITGKQQWNLSEIHNLYTQGLDHATDKLKTIWTYRTGGANIMRWACSLNNAAHTEKNIWGGGGLVPDVFLTEEAGINDFHFQTGSDRHIDVLGGLLCVEVGNSNTIPNGDVSKDDYDFTVQIEVEGWDQW